MEQVNCEMQAEWEEAGARKACGDHVEEEEEEEEEGYLEAEQGYREGLGGKMREDARTIARLARQNIALRQKRSTTRMRMREMEGRRRQWSGGFALEES